MAAELPPDTFTAAEALEFQQHDRTAAAASYQQLARSTDSRIRAAALVRLGALWRNRGDARSALRVYEELQQLGSIDVDGQPAELLARQARCRMFASSGERAQLQREAAQLAKLLSSGSVPIDRTTFAFYTNLLKEWGAPLPPVADFTRTDAALDLWRMWRADALPPGGRRLVRSDPSPVLAIWATTKAGVFARLLLPGELNQALAPVWTTLACLDTSIRNSV